MFKLFKINAWGRIFMSQALDFDGKINFFQMYCLTSSTLLVNQEKVTSAHTACPSERPSAWSVWVSYSSHHSVTPSWVEREIYGGPEEKLTPPHRVSVFIEDNACQTLPYHLKNTWVHDSAGKDCWRSSLMTAGTQPPEVMHRAVC
jgi:hypothetical protein